MWYEMKNDFEKIRIKQKELYAQALILKKEHQELKKLIKIFENKIEYLVTKINRKNKKRSLDMK